MAIYKNILIGSGGLRGFGSGDVISGGTVLAGGLMTARNGATVVGLNVEGGFVEVEKSNVSNCKITRGGTLRLITPTGLVSGVTVCVGYLHLSGGSASGTVINGGNTIEKVCDGAVEYGTVVLSGGIQQVISATISGSVLSGAKGAAGNQMLSAGAKAYDTVISTYGNQAVSSGASACNTEIYTYGQQHVQKGGYASGVIMYSGLSAWNAAYHLVEGVAHDTVVYAYGDHYVRFGGTTYHTQVYDLAWQTIDGGGIASGTTIYSGGLQGMYGASNGYECGKAYDTVISCGGMQAVESGYAERTTLVSGVQQVWDLGSAKETRVSGGAQLVAGYAVSNFICSGGNQKVISSAFDNDKTYALSSGYALSNTFSQGNQWVIDGIATLNTFAGGTQTLQGGSAYQNTLSGASQWIADGLAVSNTISGGLQVLQNGSALINRLTKTNQVLYNGYASDTVISNGNQNLGAGKVVNNTINGGSQTLGGGHAVNNNISAGLQLINGGSALVNRLTKTNQQLWKGYASDTVISNGSQQIIGGKAENNTIYGGSQFVSATAVNTTLYDGFIKMYNRSIASNTVVLGSATMENWGGSVTNLEIGKNVRCDFWQQGKWSGTLTIAGTLALHDGTGSGNIRFDVTGSRKFDYMLDTFQSGANYSVSVSRYAENGTYTLINSASAFNKSVSLYAGDTLCGTLSAGNSITVNNRTYALTTSGSSVKLTVSGRNAAGVAGDLNGDGDGDIIMTHKLQGYAGAWLIGERQTASWGNLSNLDYTQWKIFDVGGTTTDSENDIFLFNAAQNKLGAWATGADGKVTGWKDVASFNDNMNLLGLGDYNGDNQSDVLLISDYGDLGVWFTSGAKTGWKRFQSLGKEWHIAAIGDFNGDGRDDVAVTHKAGFAGCYLTQADGTVKWSNLDQLNGNEVAGAGDFNGDGVDDILLKKGNYYGAWIVENGNAKGWMGLGNIGSDRDIEQIGDFNNDGVDDLRIRVSNGAVGALLVNGANNLEWHYYGSLGKEWETSLAAVL